MEIATQTALASAPRCPDLWVSWLRLTAFRNYASAELTCDGRPVVLTGPNGAGKTNLLEAVSFLASGRGMRRAKLSEAARATGNGGAATHQAWAVAAEVQTPDGPRLLGTGLDPQSNGRERRVVKIDGQFANGQQNLGEIVAVTWLTPRMDRLFQDTPGARRRFLDRLVFGLDPAHAGRVTRYEHAQRERARLLRQDLPADPAWLSVLEARMAETGIAITVARRELIARLMRAGEAGGGAFPKAALGLSGEVEPWLDTLPALDAEERFQAALREGRAHDAEMGGAHVGPHRSDLVTHHAAKGIAAEQCSTGEQKALLIAIVLAHARLLSAARGFAPLVLLDEVAAHLDADRRSALFADLLDLGAQAWMTGTDPDLFAPLGNHAQQVRVAHADLRAAG